MFFSFSFFRAYSLFFFFFFFFSLFDKLHSFECIKSLGKIYISQEYNEYTRRDRRRYITTTSFCAAIVLPILWFFIYSARTTRKHKANKTTNFPSSIYRSILHMHYYSFFFFFEHKSLNFVHSGIFNFVHL